jgi:hypothetical protein
VLAIAAGLISLYPHAYLTLKYGFNGYYKTLHADEIRYASFVAHPYNNPYIWEKRHDTAGHEVLPAKLLSLMERLIGIENTLIAWDFLGPFLLVLTFFIAIVWPLESRYKLDLSRCLIILIGILSACFFFRLPHLISLLRYDGVSHDVTYYVTTLISRNAQVGTPRFYNPALPLPLLLLALACLAKLMRKPESGIGWALAVGMFLGISIYVRIFSYVIAGTVLLLYACSALFQSASIRLQKFKTLGFVGLGYFAASLPRLWFVFRFKLEHPEYQATHTLRGHAPDWFSVAFAIVLLLFLWGSKKLVRETQHVEFLRNLLWLPLLIVFGTMIIAVNVQVVTGMNLRPNWYWMQYLDPVLTGIFVIVALFTIQFKWSPRYVMPLLLALILGFGVLVHIVHMQLAPQINEFRDFAKDRVQDNAYRWLHDNTPDESVIATNYLSEMVATYAQRFALYPTRMRLMEMSIEEHCERYLLLQGLLGHDIAEIIANEAIPIHGKYDGMVSEALAAMPEILERSQGWYFERIMQKYKMDYVVITPDDVVRTPEGLAFFEQSPSFQPVFAEDGVTIFQITPALTGS